MNTWFVIPPLIFVREFTRSVFIVDVPRIVLEISVIPIADKVPVFTILVADNLFMVVWVPVSVIPIADSVPFAIILVFAFRVFTSVINPLSVILFVLIMLKLVVP